MAYKGVKIFHVISNKKENGLIRPTLKNYMLMDIIRLLWLDSLNKLRFSSHLFKTRLKTAVSDEIFCTYPRFHLSFQRTTLLFPNRVGPTLKMLTVRSVSRLNFLCLLLLTNSFSQTGSRFEGYLLRNDTKTPETATNGKFALVISCFFYRRFLKTEFLRRFPSLNLTILNWFANWKLKTYSVIKNAETKKLSKALLKSYVMWRCHAFSGLASYNFVCHKYNS